MKKLCMTLIVLLSPLRLCCMLKRSTLSGQAAALSQVSKLQNQNNVKMVSDEITDKKFFSMPGLKTWQKFKNQFVDTTKNRMIKLSKKIPSFDDNASHEIILEWFALLSHEQQNLLKKLLSAYQYVFDNRYKRYISISKYESAQVYDLYNYINHFMTSLTKDGNLLDKVYKIFKELLSLQEELYQRFESKEDVDFVITSKFNILQCIDSFDIDKIVMKLEGCLQSVKDYVYMVKFHPGKIKNFHINNIKSIHEVEAQFESNLRALRHFESNFNTSEPVALCFQGTNLFVASYRDNLITLNMYWYNLCPSVQLLTLYHEYRHHLQHQLDLLENPSKEVAQQFYPFAVKQFADEKKVNISQKHNKNSRSVLEQDAEYFAASHITCPTCLRVNQALLLPKESMFRKNQGYYGIEDYDMHIIASQYNSRCPAHTNVIGDIKHNQIVTNLQDSLLKHQALYAKYKKTEKSLVEVNDKDLRVDQKKLTLKQEVISEVDNVHANNTSLKDLFTIMETELNALEKEMKILSQAIIELDSASGSFLQHISTYTQDFLNAYQYQQRLIKKLLHTLEIKKKDTLKKEEKSSIKLLGI